jgi:hypothetical protein
MLWNHEGRLAIARLRKAPKRRLGVECKGGSLMKSVLKVWAAVGAMTLVMVSGVRADFLGCIHDTVPKYDDQTSSAEVIAKTVQRECYDAIRNDVKAKYGAFTPTNYKFAYYADIYDNIAIEEATKEVLKNRVALRSTEGQNDGRKIPVQIQLGDRRSEVIRSGFLEFGPKPGRGYKLERPDEIQYLNVADIPSFADRVISIVFLRNHPNKDACVNYLRYKQNELAIQGDVVSNDKAADYNIENAFTTQIIRSNYRDISGVMACTNDGKDIKSVVKVGYQAAAVDQYKSDIASAVEEARKAPK